MLIGLELFGGLGVLNGRVIGFVRTATISLCS